MSARMSIELHGGSAVRKEDCMEKRTQRTETKLDDIRRNAVGKPSSKEPSFEASLERLEQIVDEMESGSLPLKELMEHFSEGIRLSNDCTKMLERAEETMDLLVREEGGEVSASPLRIKEDA